MSRRSLLALGVFCAAVSAAAQGPGRIATTTDALIASAVFFHGKQIGIRGSVTQSGEVSQLQGTIKPIFIFWRERPARSEGEIRGEFWDLGRMADGDPRFSTYDFAAVTAAASNGRWPGRDRVFVMLGATLIDSPPPADPSLRSIAMAPAAFEDRAVTLVGRFRGRNLFGDLPQALGKSKWDFVLQSGDAAIWVSGVRPKGNDFELDPGARVDTGKWIAVTGTIRRDGDAVWLAGASIALSTAPAETPIDLSIPTTPAEPPPSVIFSAPVADDTDVPLNTSVRLQFSRDMDGRTFRDHVRVRYTGRAPSGATPPAPPAFTMTYDQGNRSLEIRFAEPLERFQTVTVVLTEGIAATGGYALKPWSLVFSTGG